METQFILLSLADTDAFSEWWETARRLPDPPAALAPLLEPLGPLYVMATDEEARVALAWAAAAPGWPADEARGTPLVTSIPEEHEGNFLRTEQAFVRGSFATVEEYDEALARVDEARAAASAAKAAAS